MSALTNARDYEPTACPTIPDIPPATRTAEEARPGHAQRLQRRAGQLHDPVAAR
ncbi:hypothetical protein GS471_05875 [Rhodococcus hoagii]|nr:hypothetical protein [Prescottella equi]